MYGQYVVPHHDDLVNFGVGQPSNDELPLEIIQNSCKDIGKITDKSLLQYGDIPGYLEFRESLALFLNVRMDIDVDVNNLFVTNGVTGALSLLCSLYRKKCAKIYVEDPTYFLAINIFKDFGFEIETVDIEEDGINLEQLEEKMKNDDSEIKLLYTIPTFHNPTSFTMSDEKRKRLSILSTRHNIVIFADEVYQLLSFRDDYNPPLPLYYYGGNTYSISSFSKILAPSLRLGWIQASQKLLEPLLTCGQLDSSGGVNPIICQVVQNIIDSGDLDEYLDKTRCTLENRCECLCNSLVKFKFLKPKGGYFLWIKLPFDAEEFLETCIKNKVKFHYGNKFSNGNTKNKYIRLSFSFYTNEGLELGALRLKESYNNLIIKKNLINLTINGYTGKLGSRIVEVVENMENINISNRLNSKDREIVPTGLNDIIIDVSGAEGLSELIDLLIDENLKIPLLIGSTGDLEIEKIRNYSQFAPVAIISNFSYGIPMLANILKNISSQNWKVTIEETHHIHKKDKPSGTAKKLAKYIDNVQEIISHREGEVYGIHKIILENEDERLEFLHNAKTRNIFAKGCIRYIEWLLNKSPGLYYNIDEPKQIKYKIMSGSGNTFVVMQEKYLNKNKIDYYCKLNSVDGLITYKLEKKHITGFDFTWKYFNRDGSLVKMCGNGSRCVAKHLSKILNTESLVFKNNFGLIQSAYVNKTRVKVLMPIWKSYKKLGNDYYIEVGVPHYVIRVKDIENYPLKNKYKDLQNSGLVCNLNIYTIRNNLVKIRTYEKGVERETGACGTGCCAVAYRILKDREVPVGASCSISFETSSKELIEIHKQDDNIYLEGYVKYL